MGEEEDTQFATQLRSLSTSLTLSQNESLGDPITSTTHLRDVRKRLESMKVERDRLRVNQGSVKKIKM